MNSRVLLGQYIPGDSLIHRLDPRAKIFLTFVFMVICFLIDSFLGYGISALFLLLIILVSGVPIKMVFRGLKPIFAILIFTTLINMWTTPGKVIWSWWIFKISREGFWRALFIALRITQLVTGTTLLTLTTSPLQLTDGLEAIFSPLKPIGFPAHEIAMMTSIALRFIPTLFEEADKIMKAQKARGANFESKRLLDTAKAMIPLMVPLFLNAIKRADELGIAMEARCYRGGEGRTRLNPLVFTQKDLVFTFTALVIMVALAYFF